MQWWADQSKAAQARVLILDVLAVPWPEPMSVSEVIECIRGCAPATVYESVRKLERQGLVEITQRYPRLHIRLAAHPELRARTLNTVPDDRGADAS
jgi:Fe2+ or Zn2+ uptake regulation protein